MGNSTSQTYFPSFPYFSIRYLLGGYWELTLYGDSGLSFLVLNSALVGSLVGGFDALHEDAVDAAFLNHLAVVHSTQLLPVVEPSRGHGVRCLTLHAQ